MNSFTPSNPIPIPSRPSTPLPLEIRPRSNTTDSVSSNGTILQTPETPPIFGLQSWSPNSPSGYPKPTGLRAKLSRSKSSLIDKTARLRLSISSDQPRTSVDSNIFDEPEYGSPLSLPVNRFEAIPRELQLIILRQVATTWKGKGRWTGEAGGRRELIRLTQVSRGWQELCLDGQLWSDLHLAPMAPFLHPRTLQLILESSKTYARRLDLRGMDALDVLTPLPNLTHLDLRGCRQLTSYDLCKVVAAPDLIHVNLKGLQAVSADVLHCLTSQHLEMLDVSRCRALDLADMAELLRTPRGKLRDLRVAGLEAGDSGGAFLRLARVKRLDLQGCNLRNEDMNLSPTITHLILSSCHALTREVFRQLDLPDLISLELAGLNIFSVNQKATDFYNFLKSTPDLQKLDLDGRGISWAVNDQLVNLLIRYCPGLTELHISYARQITPQAMIRLIRGCPKLSVLEVDNTAADMSVVIEFMRRGEGRLNVQDCRAITPSAHAQIASATRARESWQGYAALPFGYESDIGETEGVVVKTLWSWRRVGVPKVWRQARVPPEMGDKVANVFSGLPNREGNLWRDRNQRERCTIM